MASSDFFSLPRSCARLGSSQTFGSSSSALTCSSFSDFRSKSKIPPKILLARGQIGEQGGEGVEAFGFHGGALTVIQSPRLYRTGCAAGFAGTWRAVASSYQAIQYLTWRGGDTDIAVETSTAQSGVWETGLYVLSGPRDSASPREKTLQRFQSMQREDISV